MLQYSPKQSVLFNINVQHDCITCKCTESATQVVRQERQDSEIRVRAWEHAPTQRFVINLHAIHNAMELRELLPRDLTRPRPIWKDKDKELASCAGEALDKYLDKEKTRKEKVALTRQRKLAAKQSGSGALVAENAADEHAADGDEDGDQVLGASGWDDDGDVPPPEPAELSRPETRNSKRKRTQAG